MTVNLRASSRASVSTSTAASISADIALVDASTVRSWSLVMKSALSRLTSSISSSLKTTDDDTSRATRTPRVDTAITVATATPADQNVTVELRHPTDTDLAALAGFAALLQARPEHHVPYLGIDPATIAEEVRADVDDWTEAAVVAEHADGSVAGWLVGSIDHDMGRVWWFGPFVDTDEPGEWRAAADQLYDAAAGRLGEHVDEEEFAFDARHFVGPSWTVARGFAAEPGSAVVTLDQAIAPAELATRPMTPDDVATVGRLHDELFVNTHTTGAALVDSTGPDRIRLVAERDDDLLGYIAVEKQPDGSGYIDFVGVGPASRRQGIGSQLVRAGVAAMADLGCTQFHLTVREANSAARSLYAGLGFEEERVLLPFRRGFTLP